MIKRISLRMVSIVLVSSLLMACKLALKVGEIKTAKTDLEEQVLGSWYKIDDDLILVSTVRGDTSVNSTKISRLEMAKRNRLFNQDDVEELKEKQIIGERFDGRLAMVPATVSGLENPDKTAIRLAKLILKEENANRETIWKEAHKESGGTGDSGFDQYREAWAQSHKKHIKPGHWFLDNSQKWMRNAASN